MQDTVVEDAFRIAKAVRVHLAEYSCKHTIQEIVNSAFESKNAGVDETPADKTTVEDVFSTGVNYGKYRE